MSFVSDSSKGLKRPVTLPSSSGARLLDPSGPLLHFTGEDFLLVGSIGRGHRLVAVMPTLTVGWIKIGADGQTVEQHFGLIKDGFRASERKSLGDCDPNFWPTECDPWQQLHCLTFETMKGGTKINFMATQEKEIQALRDLAASYGQYRACGLMPIVEPGVSSGGNPVFKVVGWAQQQTDR